MRTSSSTNLFDVDEIVREARRLEPGTDVSFDFLAGLEALCDSLEHEAKCTHAGGVATRSGLVQSLANQARVRRNVREHPEIAAVSVGRPVFIIGLPRTGTTMLHNVLAQHTDLRCPNLWELMTPAGPRDQLHQEEAAKRAQAYVEWYYGCAPLMRIIHPMDAWRPDECQRLLGNAFHTPIYWLRHDVPSYAEWFLRHDAFPAYEFHHLQLKNILWRIPSNVPVLKDPFHIWALEALVGVYSTARFIFLHRDPVVSIASTCSLSEVCRAGRSDHIDRRAIGRFWLEQIERTLGRLPDLRRKVLHDKPVLDVRYTDLTQNTLATVQRICNFIEVPFTDESARRIRVFLAEDPLKKHGNHRYNVQDYGLDPNDLRERFATYSREYGLN